VFVLAGFGVWIFHVPMRGSWLGLFLLCMAGSVSFSGIGLLIASRVKTIEAASGLTNLVMMPMWVVSGVFFSASRFPDAVQPIIKVLPLTALIDGLRAYMLQGEPLMHLAAEMAVLCGWLAVCFTLALKIFRWR
jgi:ABC-2 type transport system permease protein